MKVITIVNMDVSIEVDIPLHAVSDLGSNIAGAVAAIESGDFSAIKTIQLSASEQFAKSSRSVMPFTGEKTSSQLKQELRDSQRAAQEMRDAAYNTKTDGDNEEDDDDFDYADEEEDEEDEEDEDVNLDNRDKKPTIADKIKPLYKPFHINKTDAAKPWMQLIFFKHNFHLAWVEDQKDATTFTTDMEKLLTWLGLDPKDFHKSVITRRDLPTRSRYVVHPIYDILDNHEKWGYTVSIGDQWIIRKPHGNILLTSGRSAATIFQKHPIDLFEEPSVGNMLLPAMEDCEIVPIYINSSQRGKRVYIPAVRTKN